MLTPLSITAIMFVSAGAGPDLWISDILDPENAAEKGFLRNLKEKMAPEREKMLENVRSYGEKDGMCYGVPFPECEELKDLTFWV